MSNVAAGRLRHFVTVEQQIVSIDTNGEQDKHWESIGQFWAAVEPLSVRELLASEQVQSQVSARVVMRYNAAVKASMRIIHLATIYNIAGVQRDPDSGMEWMTLPVTSGTNNG